MHPSNGRTDSCRLGLYWLKTRASAQSARISSHVFPLKTEKSGTTNGGRIHPSTLPSTLVCEPRLILAFELHFSRIESNGSVVISDPSTVSRITAPSHRSKNAGGPASDATRSRTLCGAVVVVVVGCTQQQKACLFVCALWCGLMCASVPAVCVELLFVCSKKCCLKRIEQKGSSIRYFGSLCRLLRARVLTVFCRADRRVLVALRVACPAVEDMRRMVLSGCRDHGTRSYRTSITCVGMKSFTPSPACLTASSQYSIRATASTRDRYVRAGRGTLRAPGAPRIARAD